MSIAPDAADCAVNRVKFLTAGHPERNRVRPAILASWERSREHGIAADRVHVPYLDDPDADSPLTRSAAPVLTRLAERLAGQSVSIILTDPAGLVLSRRTPDAGFERQLDHVLLAPGFTYAERFAGTNGIGVALATGRATQVLGHEHYAENLERLACAAVPIRHPVSGRTAGILDLTCWRKDLSDSDALLLTLAETTAEQIQQGMLASSGADELAVLVAYRHTCHRTDDVVLAVADNAVLLNDRARRELEAADQAVLVARAREISASLRSGRRRTADTVLSGDRPARLHYLSVGKGARVDGVVVRAQIGVPVPATRPSGRRPAPGGVIRTPLPGLVGSSVLWNQLTDRAQALASSGTWVALRGEAGTGKTALALALSRRQPDRRCLVLDARDPRAWPRPLAPSVGRAGTVVVAHADELADADAQLIAGLLDTCDRSRCWVAITHGPDRAVANPVLERVPCVLDVPALRLRPDDVRELAAHFAGADAAAPSQAFAADALRVLSHCQWPGNVTQLRAAMRSGSARRAARRGDQIERTDLPPDLHTASRRALTPLESMERDAIVAALASAAGDKRVAANALGISRATVYRRINEYGIRD